MPSHAHGFQGCTDVRENRHMHHFCSCILIYMHGYSTLYVWVMFFFFKLFYIYNIAVDESNVCPH